MSGGGAHRREEVVGVSAQAVEARGHRFLRHPRFADALFREGLGGGRVAEGRQAVEGGVDGDYPRYALPEKEVQR